MIEKIKKNYVYYAIFMIFLLIGFFVPVGGDDWEISSWYNNENLFSLFCKSIYTWNTFNGRILNNFFDMFLSKYSILWAFVSAMIHTLTIYYLLKSFKLENKKIFPFLMLVLFLMVSSGFRMEVQLHKIGNISYTIPTFFIFFTIYLMNKYNESILKSKIHYMGMFLLGLFCSLWIENLTIASLCTSFLILILYYFRNKKINKYCLFVILGGIAGSLILFSSPGFLNRYNSSTGGLSTIELIRNNIPVILNSITLEQKSIYLLYSFVCLFALSKHKTKKGRNISSNSLKIYYLLLGLLLLTSIILEEFAKHSGVVVKVLSQFNNIFFSTNSIICILLMISILLSIPIIILKLLEKDKKENALVLYFLSVVSVAPMVLSPGNRNYILCFYSLFVIITLILSTINMSRIKKEQKMALLIILGVLFCFRLESYNYILSRAYQVSKMRNEIIQEFKINQIKAADNEEYLILPIYDKEIIGNMNSEYYIPSIINYYELKANTKVLFNDYFMYLGMNLDKIEHKTNLYRITINTKYKGIKQYNLKVFNQINSEIVYENSSENPVFDFKIDESGKYLFNCTMINDKNEYQIKNEVKEIN